MRVSVVGIHRKVTFMPVSVCAYYETQVGSISNCIYVSERVTGREKERERKRGERERSGARVRIIISV